MATAGLIISGIGVLVSAVVVGVSIWGIWFPPPWFPPPWFPLPWYETTWGMCIIIGGILAFVSGVWVIALKSRKR